MRVLDAIDERAIDDLLAAGSFFWLDLVAPDDDEIDRLAQRFGWHPLAVEDVKELGQRPKLDRYGDHLLLVFYGLRTEDDGARGTTPRPLEVHLLISGAWVVTVRRHASAALDEVRRRLAADETATGERFAAYRILDALTDTFFPALERIDDAIERLEDAILARADDHAHVEQVFHLRRALSALRRIVTPQRDLAQRTIAEISELPGFDAGSHPWFRDVYDHLIRISEEVDGYRDLLTGVMDVYLSTASNRMNAVMKQLTLVSTVFLPVTALTGFFGMNFGWLVAHIDSAWSFLVLGVGGAIVAALALLLWFRRARMLG